jgi:hypothetical protein
LSFSAITPAALAVWAFAGASASRRDLAASVRELDGKVAAWQTNGRESGGRAESRVSRLEKAVESQALAAAKGDEQLRAQVVKLQAKLAGAVTAQQLRDTRAEMMEAIKRLEAALSRPVGR